MNLRKLRAARQRAADVSSAEPSFFCRQDAGSTLRFMERDQTAKKRSAVDSGVVFTANGCTP